MGSQGEDGASGSKNMMSSSFKEKNAIRDKMKKDKTKKPTDEETLRQQKKLEERRTLQRRRDGPHFQSQG